MSWLFLEANGLKALVLQGLRAFLWDIEDLGAFLWDIEDLGGGKAGGRGDWGAEARLCRDAVRQ